MNLRLNHHCSRLLLLTIAATFVFTQPLAAHFIWVSEEGGKKRIVFGEKTSTARWYLTRPAPILKLPPPSLKPSDPQVESGLRLNLFRISKLETWR